MAFAEQINLSQLDNWFDRFGDEALKLDYTPVLKQLAVLLRQVTLDNFAGEHGPDGQAWPPLTQATIDGRRKGPGAGTPKILQDRGLLRASYSARGGEGIEELTPFSLEYGSAVPYAGYHQDGTGKIPARPQVGINQFLLDRFERILGDYIEKQLGGGTP